MLNELVNLLIVLVVALLTISLPVLYQRAKVWAERQYQLLPQNTREALEDAALTGARFVEQLGLSHQLQDGLISLASDKMNMAVDYGKQLLTAQGYRVTEDTDAALRGLIENVILAGQHKKDAVIAERGGVLPPDLGDDVPAQPEPFPITAKRLPPEA